MEYGAAVKQLVFVTLLVNIMLPSDQLVTAAGAAAVAASLALYLLKVVLTAVVIGLIEVGTVKFRLFSVPNLAALAFILSFLGFLQSFVFGGAYV
jgi:formate hydrogenlyase subunit 4